MNNMKILITGTEGYIGVLLASILQKRGHSVTGLDTGYYRSGLLYGEVEKTHPQIRKDIRHITEQDLIGYDAVVHLAELSNDTLGQLNPEVTFEINHLGSVDLARKSKRVGVPRFIYASSCSVYGVDINSDIKTEISETHPQTAYAQCKVLVERDVLEMADKDFSPTFLRNATAYGPSPRMRFDIVLNNLAGLAWTSHEIKLTSDGTPWRPLVHVIDICGAIFCVLEAPRNLIHNETFNVGSTSENYQIRDIANIIAEVFPESRISFGQTDSDNRSYRVSFDKIHQQLSSFHCHYDVRKGAIELRELFERIELSKKVFQKSPFTRLKQINELIANQEVDERLFWRV